MLRVPAAAGLLARVGRTCGKKMMPLLLPLHHLARHPLLVRIWTYQATIWVQKAQRLLKPGRHYTLRTVLAFLSIRICSQQLCCSDDACAGFIFEAQSDVSFSQCKRGEQCCFLKRDVSKSHPKTVSPAVGMVLFKMDRKPSPAPSVSPPPMGLRSSPALGGLGAGSVELRSDGSFRDWTIFNQGNR